MNSHARKIHSHIIFITFLIVLSLACHSVTITIDSNSPTSESVTETRQIGFDFSEQVPSSPEGDTSARRHLFLHEYSMPLEGFVTGIVYLNDSDTAIEAFDLLILRPGEDGWEVVYRINVSDDTPPAQRGTTVVNLSSPLAVKSGDIFAHWQDSPNGALPLNIDNDSLDGFSIGQYGFQSFEVEVGQQIGIDGFNGHRDYFINVAFSASP